MAKHSGQRPRQAARPRPAPTRRPTAPRRPDHDLDTEARILDAAHSVFLRHGTAGARMQEIADEAGVNKALLHYYFRSKDRLAAVVFGRVVATLLPPLAQVLVPDATLEQIVRRIVPLYIDLLRRHPYVAPYVVGELHQHPERLYVAASAASGVDLPALRGRAFTLLAAKLEAAVGLGTIRPIAIEDFVVNLLGLCIFPFLARPMLTHVVGMDDAAFDRFIQRRKREVPDLFLRALNP